MRSAVFHDGNFAGHLAGSYLAFLMNSPTIFPSGSTFQAPAIASGGTPSFGPNFPAIL